MDNPMTSSTSIESVDHTDTSIMIEWADAHTSHFPLRWLRYECKCEQCGESSTGIRFLTLAMIPKDLSVRACGDDNEGNLEVIWGPEEHRSCYEPSWLRRHCLENESRAGRVHYPTTWGQDLVLPQVSFDEYENDASRRCDAYEAIRDYGLVHIVDGPPECGMAERLALKIGHLEDTNFGAIVDLRSTPDPSNIGLTNHPATLHTDNSYRNMPTGVVAIHCVQASDPGTGYSLFADGFNLARKLEQADPKAYEILCSVPIMFNRRYPEAIVMARAPIISRDREGRVIGFRFQDRSMAPLDIEPSQADLVLDAIAELMTHIDDPRNQLKFRLAPGEAVLFDNHRLMHGRTGFTGPRHLQIGSVNRDTFISEMRVLERDLGCEGPYLRIAGGAFP